MQTDCLPLSSLRQHSAVYSRGITSSLPLKSTVSSLERASGPRRERGRGHDAHAIRLLPPAGFLRRPCAATRHWSRSAVGHRFASANDKMACQISPGAAVRWRAADWRPSAIHPPWECAAPYHAGKGRVV
eukprot:355524-Chlamydomonas_euryale.AAC.44